MKCREDISKLLCLCHNQSHQSQKKWPAKAHSVTRCYQVTDREQGSHLNTNERGMNGSLWNKSSFTEQMKEKIQPLPSNKMDRPQWRFGVCQKRDMLLPIQAVDAKLHPLCRTQHGRSGKNPCKLAWHWLAVANWFSPCPWASKDRISGKSPGAPQKLDQGQEHKPEHLWAFTVSLPFLDFTLAV